MRCLIEGGRLKGVGPDHGKERAGDQVEGGQHGDSVKNRRGWPYPAGPPGPDAEHHAEGGQTGKLQGFEMSQGKHQSRDDHRYPPPHPTHLDVTNYASPTSPSTPALTTRPPPSADASASLWRMPTSAPHSSWQRAIPASPCSPAARKTFEQRQASNASTWSPSKGPLGDNLGGRSRFDRRVTRVSACGRPSCLLAGPSMPDMRQRQSQVRR